MAGQSPRQRPGGACEECRRKRIRCDRGIPQCTACATSGGNCVVRDSFSPRGPKKGYLKTLQKRIEDLQSQLEKQQGASTIIAAPEMQATSPSQDGGSTGNDGGSSVDNNEIQDNTSTNAETAIDIPQWPAPMEFHFPIIDKEPWECFDNSYTNSPFPSLHSIPSIPSLSSLDNLQELVQNPKDSDLLITPMMHNDLPALLRSRLCICADIAGAPLPILV
ncbi:Nitrogen assimilation transcription factor nirA 4 [Colletotrichum truncatum]|uniref:Nitrogen assimilation transcription factor nirA 4 n=1 Tax=Colletotrichum truncatum TaxID=5467 RepID=A0ACC3YDV7_COLTU